MSGKNFAEIEQDVNDHVENYMKKITQSKSELYEVEETKSQKSAKSNIFNAKKVDDVVNEYDS